MQLRIFLLAQAVPENAPHQSSLMIEPHNSRIRNTAAERREREIGPQPLTSKGCDSIHIKGVSG